MDDTFEQIDNIDDEISNLESRLQDLTKQSNSPSITPDEYARIVAEYTSIKQQISSLKIQRFMDGV